MQLYRINVMAAKGAYNPGLLKDIHVIIWLYTVKLNLEFT